MTVDHTPTSDGTPSGVSLARALLLDAFGRVHEELPTIVEGLSSADLQWRPGPDANPIGWLLWHLSRVQDDHLAALSTACGRDRTQVWADWRERFALPYGDDIGYGQTSAQVAEFHLADPQLLVGYADAVHAMTVEVLNALSAADFARVVDDSWDPPVTAAVRLVSVVNDTTAHIGQAAYVKGLLAR